MISFRQSLRMALEAAKANLLPGLVLQLILVIFFVAYLLDPNTQKFLTVVEAAKESSGFLFAALSYLFAGAFLPEVLRVLFFQSGRPSWDNISRFLTSAPLWAFIGILIDAFYQLQTILFGTSNAWTTILPKLVVDQFIFSPFLANPIILSYLLWRDAGFHRNAAKVILTRSFVFEKLFPVQVAAWCVWIPGVVLVYAMPVLLQIPVAVAIQCFWVLLLTTVNARTRKIAD